MATYFSFKIPFKEMVRGTATQLLYCSLLLRTFTLEVGDLSLMPCWTRQGAKSTSPITKENAVITELWVRLDGCVQVSLSLPSVEAELLCREEYQIHGIRHRSQVVAPSPCMMHKHFMDCNQIILS